MNESADALGSGLANACFSFSLTPSRFFQTSDSRIRPSAYRFTPNS